MTKITQREINLAKNLKMIMQFGVGIEGVDINAATSRNIWVCNIPSESCGNAKACAEHCIYLTLYLLRNQKEMENSLLKGRLGFPTGKTIYNSNILIYGFGGMGKNLLKRLFPSFEPKKITIMVRDKSKFESLEKAINNSTAINFLDEVNEENEENFENVEKSAQKSETVRFIDDPAALSEALLSASVVYLCCSLNESTVGLVGEGFLRQLPPHCLLVNVSRGGLVDHRAVWEALEGGRLGGMGTDVFHTEPFPPEDPLLRHPLVVATPHVGGVTEISYQNMAMRVADNVRRVARGERPLGAINEPLFDLSDQTKYCKTKFYCD
jgi:phosphoglycerate dehydrogenase-like enzyme